MAKEQPDFFDPASDDIVALPTAVALL